MNVRFVTTLILYVTGLLAIVYGVFGLIRMLETFYSYAAQGINIIDLISYNIDFIFIIILSIGSGLAQLIAGRLLSETTAKKAVQDSEQKQP